MVAGASVTIPTLIASLRGSEGERHLTTDGESNSAPSWSPNGKLDVVCTATANGNDLKLLTPPDMHAIYPGWAPKGELIFASANEGQPRAIMLLGKDGQIRSTSHSGFFARVAPNGGLIAVIDGRYPESRIRVEQY